MRPAQKSSVVSIAHHVHGCFDEFEAAAINLNKADQRTKSKLSPGVLLDELGRFRVWSGNIGAHGQGKISLDYRLREASHLRDRVIELLRSLRAVLADILSIVKGEKIPWEDLSVSDSDSDSEDDEHFPVNELSQLMPNAGEATTCLMRLSMAIRNPAPHDQFQKSKHINFSHYEEFNVNHVRAKFPLVPEYLALRFGKAISRRRQYLSYREEHRKRLEQGLAPTGGPDKSSLGPSQGQADVEVAPSELAQSTKASSIPLEAKDTMDAKDATPAADLDTADIFEDSLSQTSYTSSNYDETRLRPPPLPKAGSDGEPFECPLCYRIARVKTLSAWHKHVYRDLQPYVRMMCPH